MMSEMRFLDFYLPSSRAEVGRSFVDDPLLGASYIYAQAVALHTRYAPPTNQLRGEQARKIK